MQDFQVDIVNSPISISFGIVIDVVDSHSGKHIPKSPDFRFRFSMSLVVYDISPHSLILLPLESCYRSQPPFRIFFFFL